MRFEQDPGYFEEGPGRGTPPRRPPWSLVLPRYSTFLGREDDDWQIDASRPLLEEPGTLTGGAHEPGYPRRAMSGRRSPSA